MKTIENYKKTVMYLKETAKHYEAGNHEKAYHSTPFTHDNSALATEARIGNLKFILLTNNLW